MAAYTLIGKDFIPPDLRGKVTGAARYAEDFRVEGMLFAKLLTSLMPHAKVRHIDASKALAMPGVVALLTADDVPQVTAPQEPILTNEPLYAGEPILAGQQWMRRLPQRPLNRSTSTCNRYRL